MATAGENRFANLTARPAREVVIEKPEKTNLATARPKG